MGDVTDVDNTADVEDGLPVAPAEVVADLRSAFVQEPEPHVATDHVRKMMEVAPPARVIPLRKPRRSRRRALAATCAVAMSVGVGGTWAAAAGHLPDRLQSIASAMVEPFGIEWPDGTRTEDADESGTVGDDPVTDLDGQAPSEPDGVGADAPRTEGSVDPSRGADAVGQEAGQEDPSGSASPDDGAPPGQQRTPPGQERTPPGQQRVPPGQQQTPPGQQKIPPGQQQTPPGQQQTPPGQQQTPPGQQQTPPGQQKIPPGQTG